MTSRPSTPTRINGGASLPVLSSLSLFFFFVQPVRHDGAELFPGLLLLPPLRLSGSDHQTQLAFLERWLDAHIADARLVLRKPLLLAEFGISRKDLGFSPAQRDALFTAVYAKVYRSARAGGPAAGALFWHLLEPGMEVYGDGYEIVFREIPSSTASIIAEQGRRLRYLGKLGERLRNVEKLEKARAMNAQPSRSSVGDGG